MKTIFLVVLILFNSVLSFSQVVKLQVYPEMKRQTMVSIGGNYCQANYTGNAWDLPGEATLREFRPGYVRVALPLQFRDLPYADYSGEKINNQKAVISLHEAMQRMKNEFGVYNFTVSVWRVADELVENPERDNKRRIKPEKYEEVIDMIVAFLLKAKSDYGVEADYFSFNESDGGYMTIFSPDETIRFFKMAGERFRKAGLKTKFLWADTAQTKGTVEFATMIAADSTIWKYLGPLCFHSWWSEKIPDSEFERVAAFAKAWGKEVWCSELGFDAMAWKQKGMNASWDYAFRFAKIFHRIVRYAEVSVSQYWTWQNNYSIMTADTLQKYPSYYVTRHQVRYLNNGTKIIHSSCNDPEILSIAGISKSGSPVLQIINLKNKPVSIEVFGLNGTPETIIRTSENNLWKEEKIASGQSSAPHTFILDPVSVNSVLY